MGRIAIVFVMLIISGIIYLVKAAASKVTGNEVNFQDESRKVMEKAARGVNWMNDQWEKAKQNSNGSDNSHHLALGNDLKFLTPTEIIAKVKNDTQKYDMATAEGLLIEIAVFKMQNRQFDDAEKLIMQLSEGEARSFMLNEVSQKRLH
jgi:hypothetical protein